jgi:hypothetical protein
MIILNCSGFNLESRHRRHQICFLKRNSSLFNVDFEILERFSLHVLIFRPANKTKLRRVQGQIDGNEVSANFILVPRRKASPPPRPAPSPRKETRGPPLHDGSKDGGPRRGRICELLYFYDLVVSLLCRSIE